MTDTKETTTATVPKESHKQIAHLAIDEGIEIKQAYAIIIPLGIDAYQKIKLSKNENVNTSKLISENLGVNKIDSNPDREQHL